MKPVGGRGKTAPYISTHVRVPIPVKHIVELVIERYRERLERQKIHPNVDDNSEEYLRSKSEQNNPLTTYENINKAIEILTQSLKLKSNAGGAIKEEIRRALNLLQKSSDHPDEG